MALLVLLFLAAIGAGRGAIAGAFVVGAVLLLALFSGLLKLPAPGPSEEVEARRSRHISQAVKVAVSVRDGGRCRRCGSSEALQFDHITPYSWGGENTAENIQLLCGPCNRRKSNRHAG